MASAEPPPPMLIPASTPQNRARAGSSPRISPLNPVPKFQVGQLVNVQPRTWPGINKHGGVGHVTKINLEGRLYDVRYVVGGSERNIEEKFIEPGTLDVGPRPVKERDFFHNYTQERPKRSSSAGNQAASSGSPREGRFRSASRRSVEKSSAVARARLARREAKKARYALKRSRIHAGDDVSSSYSEEEEDDDKMESPEESEDEDIRKEQAREKRLGVGSTLRFEDDDESVSDSEHKSRAENVKGSDNQIETMQVEKANVTSKLEERDPIENKSKATVQEPNTKEKENNVPDPINIHRSTSTGSKRSHTPRHHAAKAHKKEHHGKAIPTSSMPQNVDAPLMNEAKQAEKAPVRDPPLKNIVDPFHILMQYALWRPFTSLRGHIVAEPESGFGTLPWIQAKERGNLMERLLIECDRLFALFLGDLRGKFNCSATVLLQREGAPTKPLVLASELHKDVIQKFETVRDDLMKRYELEANTLYAMQKRGFELHHGRQPMASEVPKVQVIFPYSLS